MAEKLVVRTEEAPGPFQGAPYNQAIRVGDLVFVAGQIGLRPGETAVEGDVAQQTEQALRNLAAILEAAGSSLDNLVKTSVFRIDMADFAAMNEVFRAVFPVDPPVRATIGVAGLAGAFRVEVDLTAAR